MDSTKTQKTNAQIQRDELKWDMRVVETDVGVQARNGVVMLTGTVQSWASRLQSRRGA